jgi:hypothetical protein
LQLLQLLVHCYDNSYFHKRIRFNFLQRYEKNHELRIKNYELFRKFATNL